MGLRWPFTTARPSVMNEVYERNPNTPGGLVACETMQELVAAVKKPRKFIILVKAGPAVDAVTKELIDAGVRRTTSSSIAATRCGPTRFAASGIMRPVQILWLGRFRRGSRGAVRAVA